jgi:hypothetical protein
MVIPDVKERSLLMETVKHVEHELEEVQLSQLILKQKILRQFLKRILFKDTVS